MYTDSREKRPDEARADDCSEAQLATLLEAIARSQHNHRDLIDNLDQAVFTLSLEGEVRVANRRLAEMLDVSFHDLIGHRLSEFLDRPPWARSSARFRPSLRKAPGRVRSRCASSKEVLSISLTAGSKRSSRAARRHR